MPSKLAPVAQIRVIAPVDDTARLGTTLVRCARYLLGPHLTYRITTRPARRAGYTRYYLTVTRKEDDNHDSPDG